MLEKDIPEVFERCRAMIAERRERATDDLMSVLVHAEVDGEKLEEIDIVMGFFLLMAAGNDSTKATYSSGMKALMENPDQKRELIEDPTLIPAAVEEALRMFPAFAHFRRTATCDAELHGQKIKQGEKVVIDGVLPGVKIIILFARRSPPASSSTAASIPALSSLDPPASNTAAGGVSMSTRAPSTTSVCPPSFRKGYKNNPARPYLVLRISPSHRKRPCGRTDR